jgi:hypothetical protein
MQRRMDRSNDHRDDEADRVCATPALTRAPAVTRALLLHSAPAPPGKVPREKPHPTPCRAARATALEWDVGSKRHRTGSWLLDC